MKTLFITAMLALAMATSSFATPSAVNIKSASEFNNIYKNSNNLTWKFAENFQKASLEINGEKTEVFYTPDGELIGSSKIFAFDKLPKAALKTLATKYAYPAYILEECIVLENADHDSNYYVSLKKANEKIVLEISEKGAVSVLTRKS